MIGFSKYVSVGAALAIALMLAWAIRLDGLRADWRDKFLNLTAEAGTVLASVRIASDNPKLAWKDAAKQVDEIGMSRAVWKNHAEGLSGQIDQMGAETARLKSENATLVAKVRALNARRTQLIAKVEQDALDPGDVADCWAQIREVEESLNRLRQEGF